MWQSEMNILLQVMLHFYVQHENLPPNSLHKDKDAYVVTDIQVSSY